MMIVLYFEKSFDNRFGQIIWKKYKPKIPQNLQKFQYSHEEKIQDQVAKDENKYYEMCNNAGKLNSGASAVLGLHKLVFWFPAIRVRHRLSGDTAIEIPGL